MVYLPSGRKRIMAKPRDLIKRIKAKPSDLIWNLELLIAMGTRGVG